MPLHTQTTIERILQIISADAALKKQFQQILKVTPQEFDQFLSEPDGLFGQT